jgi:EmrB/QacA subfamily drug resistance transporter
MEIFMTNGSSTRARAASHTAVLVVVCLALATVVAAMASLNVALPSIARGTHATQTQLSWIIDAYSLVFATLLLPSGAIGDRYGRRKGLLLGLAIFGCGSLVAMTAHGAVELIALRGVLGLGASLVMPATLSTITRTMPEAERTRGVAIWAGVAGASAVVGLLVSGSLLEFWSWRSVFALNVVLAVISIIGVAEFVPESADPEAPRLDIIGSLLAVVGLVSVVYSIIEAPNAGWGSSHTLVGLFGGLLVLVGFVTWEFRTDAPMLDPRLFRRRRLSAGTLSIFVQFFSFFGFTFISLQYLQLVRGYSPLHAAVSVLPLAATMVGTSRLAPLMVNRLGARRVCSSGLLFIALGLVVLSRLDTTSSYFLFLFGIVLLGAGMGAASTPATSGITGALPASQQGVGSALNDLSREVGGALGIAVIGSILNATYRSHLHLPAIPASIDARASGSFALANHAGGAVARAANSAFVFGINTALLFAAGAAFMAAVGIFLLLGRPGSATEAVTSSVDEMVSTS